MEDSSLMKSVFGSRLGFGFMRPPFVGDQVDVPQLTAMVDAFMAAGGSYFDTAPVYLEGRSEDLLRQLLVERYPRSSFQLATKLSAWVSCTCRADAEKMFQESLKHTGAGYFDAYLLHSMSKDHRRLFDRIGAWDFAREQKAAGRIRSWGFSFHDTPELLDELLREHPDADFVQLQLNYADWEDPNIQSRACYEVARAHGKPIVVMEPVKGGLLASPHPDAVALLDKLSPGISPAVHALRFVAALPGVVTVLSGMSSLEQLTANLPLLGDVPPLDDKVWELYMAAGKILAQQPVVACTNCKYCMEKCPAQIPVPEVFTVLNRHRRFQGAERLKNDYQRVAGAHPASSCVNCGACEKACPQHLPIRQLLQEAKAVLE